MQVYRKNERILCRLSKSEILRLCSIAHAAMETTKTPNFTCQSKSLTSTFFTCQVSACELQPFDSLAMIRQMTYTHKLPKLCSATNDMTIYYFFKLVLLFPSHHWVVELPEDEHLRKGLNVLEFPKLFSRVEEPTAPGVLS